MTKLNLFAIVLLTVLAGQAHAEPSYRITTEILPKTPTIKTVDNSFSITIIPIEPWVLKMKTPLKIALSVSQNLQITKTTLGKEDVVNPKSNAKKFKTTFSSTLPGKHFISANASFFLCTPEICKRFIDEIHTDLIIQQK